MKTLQNLLFAIPFIVQTQLHAQPEVHISPKMTLAWHRNIETYFIAEKLAVQHIGYYVFTRKDSSYAHQPLLHAASGQFARFVNTPCVRRIAALMQYFRDTYYDNAQVLQWLLHEQPFPERGELYPFADTSIFHPAQHLQALANVHELTDSLRSFYCLAGIGNFLDQHRSYYAGALAEVRKNLRPDVIPFMESFYGEAFAAYSLYIMPLMPIPPGEDNYRAFGPVMHLPKGKVATMVFSSSRMLPPGRPLNSYRSFGFDNPDVTRFLTVHEISHSFVNPHVDSLMDDVMRDTALFTPALQKAQEPYYISNWRVCVIEHLVRLGEIRVAEQMHDSIEAARLRKLHVKAFHFVLLPLLEKKIVEYENNRQTYPDFASFLPELLQVFHSLTPERVDRLLKENS